MSYNEDRYNVWIDDQLEPDNKITGGGAVAIADIRNSHFKEVSAAQDKAAEIEKAWTEQEREDAYNALNRNYEY